MKLRDILDYLREKENVPFTEELREEMRGSFQTVIPPSEEIPDPDSLVSGCLYLAGSGQEPCMLLDPDPGEGGRGPVRIPLPR